MQILPSGGKLPTRTRLRMLKEMPATFLTIRYRMRLSTFDYPPVYSSAYIPIIARRAAYLPVVGRRENEDGPARARPPASLCVKVSVNDQCASGPVAPVHQRSRQSPERPLRPFLTH